MARLNDAASAVESIPLFIRLVDLWVYAQVAECLEVASAHELRCGGPTSRFELIIKAAEERLGRERPEVMAVLAARGGVQRPDPPAQVAAEYMVAECFEEFGDAETAARVRCGGAGELLVAVTKLAIDRLARALDCVGGVEFTGGEWSEPESFEEFCERYDSKLALLMAKFFVAEVIGPYNQDLAGELRSGSSAGWTWFWDLEDETIALLEPEFVSEIRQPSWPRTRDVHLTDLLAAGKLGLVANVAYVKLHVGDPAIRSVAQEYRDGIDRLRLEIAVVDKACQEFGGTEPPDEATVLH